MSAPRNDLAGRRFGKLTVLGYAGERGTRHYWKVVCDCGKEKECSGESLLYAGVTSCGCARKGAAVFREKRAVTAEQRAWLEKHFRNTRNEEIMERFGWSHSFLHRLAREMGLRKTGRFQSKCQRNAADKAKKNINAFLKGLEVAFDETFNYAMCRVPEGMKERTEALQSYADDIVRLLILYYSRVDGDPQGNDKRQKGSQGDSELQACSGVRCRGAYQVF